MVARGAEGMPQLEPLLAQRNDGWHDGSHEERVERDALAESFVDFLLMTGPGKKAFTQVIGNITSKSEGTPAIDPKQVRKLESFWHAHLQQVVKNQK